jgi:uncharacterized repeat protein (TIGR03803 family)
MTFLGLLAITGCGGGNTPGPSYNNRIVASGLASNESVTLENNGAAAVTLTANGTSTFPANWSAGSTYAVSVKSHTPNITCSTSQATGTLGTADVTVHVSCSAGTKSILYSFTGNQNDGASPYTGLIMDSVGNFFGITGDGGSQGSGTVFKLIPDGSGGYSDLILDSLTPPSPAPLQLPTGRLLRDSTGALYGVMPYGGTTNNGAVFKLTPAINGSYTESILYSFTGGSDGAYPFAGLVQDSAGNLYGATTAGASGGTIFKLSPNHSGGYDFSVLHTFTQATEGDYIYGTLLLDAAGNLYGVTMVGGPNNGAGTVFKLAPDQSLSVLHTFAADPSDGGNPWGALVMDSSGNLFGTTTAGGAHGKGTVFKLTSDGHGGYNESVLYSFASGDTDGEAPYAGVVVDHQGNLFGITTMGGIGGHGVVFKLRPNGDGTYSETMLYSLAATISDYGAGYGELLLDSAGNLYGTVRDGGANNYGYVFMIH